MDLILVFSLFAGICGASDPYFWHITDFHFDPTYVTSRDSCNDVISDPGRYGDFECDAPYVLLRSAVQAMRDVDTVAHLKNYSSVTTPFVINILQNATDLFQEYFPDTQFVVALGNHDYFPKNQLPGEENNIYNATTDMWSHWFNYSESIMDTFSKGSYYTAVLDADLGLRVVVINTNLYQESNTATEGEADPAGQYAWLRGVLTQARADSEKVHLVVHVPPGVMNAPGSPRWLREEDNTRFNNMVREFHDVIMGYYSCHEHQDSFRIYYQDGQPVSVLLVAPSVTPWRARIGNNIRAAAHNPAVRKIVYDGTSGQLLDIEQYYLDLSATNRETSPAVWRLLYSFKELYAVDDVTPGAVHELAERIAADNSVEFTHFREMTLVKTNHSSISSSCDCSCKALHVCSILHVDYDDFDQCLHSTECQDSSRGNRMSQCTLVLVFIFVSSSL